MTAAWLKTACLFSYSSEGQSMKLDSAEIGVDGAALSGDFRGESIF